MTFSCLMERFSNSKGKYRFFDVNCWMGENPFPGFQRFKDLSELVAEMDKYSIERALVSHFLAWKYNPFVGNNVLADEIQKSERFYGYYVLFPPGTEKTGDIGHYIDEMVKNKKARGFRFSSGSSLFSCRLVHEKSFLSPRGPSNTISFLS